MTDDADHVVLTLPRGDRGEIRIARSRFQGKTFTRLQLFYPAPDGELRPGRQVITVRDHELGDVVAALMKIAAKIGPQAQTAERPRRQTEHRERNGDDAEDERGLF